MGCLQGDAVVKGCTVHSVADHRHVGAGGGGDWRVQTVTVTKLHACCGQDSLPRMYLEWDSICNTMTCASSLWWPKGKYFQMKFLLRRVISSPPLGPTESFAYTVNPAGSQEPGTQETDFSNFSHSLSNYCLKTARWEQIRRPQMLGVLGVSHQLCESWPIYYG